MAKYILKRILYIFLIFIILSFVLFMIYGLMPGDRAATTAADEVRANRKLNYEERYEYWQKRYGLDGNLFQRYLRWIGVYPYSDGSFNGMLQGNLGSSIIYNKPVTEVISVPMGNTVFINIFATILGLAITIPLGIFCAVKKGNKRDVTVQVFTIVGYSLPTFIIAILFIWLFSIVLKWFPIASNSGLNKILMEYAAQGESIEQGSFKYFWINLYCLILPIVVMTFGSLGGMTRYVRASMIEALSMDCIRTARAKGLKERVVIYSHAWRNALIPIVTLVVGWFLGIFSGSVMIERIFGINGLGNLYYKALGDQDNELILALQMFYILIGLVGNLLIDLLYGLVDPRIRVNK